MSHTQGYLSHVLPTLGYEPSTQALFDNHQVTAEDGEDVWNTEI